MTSPTLPILPPKRADRHTEQAFYERHGGRGARFVRRIVAAFE